MTEPTKRWLSLVEKMGGEEEARAEMRRRAEKSKRNLGGKGGFAALTPEQRVEISRKGGKVSRRSETIKPSSKNPVKAASEFEVTPITPIKW